MEVTVNKSKVTVTDDERAIVVMFSNGQSATKVARSLNLAPRTIESKLARLRYLFNVENTTHLVATFLRKGLIK
jgi:DNA-binding CsgD family transcriptional regulator